MGREVEHILQTANGYTTSCLTSLNPWGNTNQNHKEISFHV